MTEWIREEEYRTHERRVAHNHRSIAYFASVRPRAGLLTISSVKPII